MSDEMIENTIFYYQIVVDAKEIGKETTTFKVTLIPSDTGTSQEHINVPDVNAPVLMVAHHFIAFSPAMVGRSYFPVRFNL